MVKDYKNISELILKIKSFIIKFGEMQATPKVQYMVCNRGGYHTG